MLNLAGYNWAVANYDADRNPAKGPQPAIPPPSVRQKWEAARIRIPDALPTAYTTDDRGIITQPEELSDQLVTALRKNNTRISDGDRAALATAVSAWRSFAEHDACSAGGARLQNIIGTFTAVQAPEAPDVVENLTVLRDGVNAIQAAALGFATAANGYETHLSDFRSALAGAVPDAFPSDAASSTITDVAVLIACSGNISPESVDTAATVLARAVAGHYLYAYTAEANFPDADTLPIVQSKLQEIAQSPIDELANRATWNSGPIKCTLKPDGEQDFGGANDRVKSWIQDAVEYGNQAGVDPRLVLTILYNEGAKRSDSWIEDKASIAWDVVRESGNDVRELTNDGVGMSLGLANMKESTFNKLKELYPEEFGAYSWFDIVANDSLAIKAAAFTLSRLNSEWASGANEKIVEQLSLSEYLALSYNAEGFLADYNKLQAVGPEGQKYINMTNENWKIATDLMDGAYNCR